MDMLQEFVHEGSLPPGEGSQIGNATIQIPGNATFAEDLKNPIAENQQARTAEALQ